MEGINSLHRVWLTVRLQYGHSCAIHHKSTWVRHQQPTILHCHNTDLFGVIQHWLVHSLPVFLFLDRFARDRFPIDEAFRFILMPIMRRTNQFGAIQSSLDTCTKRLLLMMVHVLVDHDVRIHASMHRSIRHEYRFFIVILLKRNQNVSRGRAVHFGAVIWKTWQKHKCFASDSLLVFVANGRHRKMTRCAKRWKNMEKKMGKQDGRNHTQCVQIWPWKRLFNVNDGNERAPSGTVVCSELYNSSCMCLGGSLIMLRCRKAKRQ